MNDQEQKARKKLFDAVCSGNIENVTNACRKVKRIGKQLKDIKEDGTDANALHLSLTTDNVQVFDYLLESEGCDDEFLAAEFDVELNDQLHS